jgi:hypothetical protein
LSFRAVFCFINLDDSPCSQLIQISKGLQYVT